jgi:hypothetical protein
VTYLVDSGYHLVTTCWPYPRVNGCNWISGYKKNGTYGKVGAYYKVDTDRKGEYKYMGANTKGEYWFVGADTKGGYKYVGVDNNGGYEYVGTDAIGR